MHKYTELYRYFKELIVTGQLKAGDKVPSICKASDIFGVSKTTVQSAYFNLQADGYILSEEKSGYYVSTSVTAPMSEEIEEETSQRILYDLKSGTADKDSFNIALWQRYIKSALRQSERLLSYGDVHGERDLREALSEYIREKRNVTASPDRIIVGAGIQSLLSILCALLKGKNTVSFPDNSFIQGISLFENYGFQVHTRDKDADIIYVSPSHMTSYGDIMPISRRLELIRYSTERHSLVIEDDFDNDFLYNIKPTPSLHALSGGKNVVYLGSFSNVLIPGIRISFMVLTEELYNCFKENKYKFSQTASKTEQIALCQYIRDGHIKSQTKKIRRIYTAKAKAFYDEIKQQMPEAYAAVSDNGLQIKLQAPFKGQAEDFEESGIAVHINSYKNGVIQLVLSPSAVDNTAIPKAVSLLKSILYP